MLPDPLFLNVHMYGIMIAVGLLLAFLIISLYSKRLSIDQKLSDFVFYDGVFSVLVGFGSASLFQSLYNFLEDPSKGFKLGGGITFIGGLIGGAAFFLIVYFILRKKLKIDLLEVLPVIPCAITIGHAFGRVGCFFAGCCYGKQTDSIFGVVFPEHTSLGKVHPTQLYEAIFLFILFGILSYLLLAKKYKYTMSVYLISYGVFRFLLEFLRGDDRGSFLGILSPSQFWSAIMILIGIGWYFLQDKLAAQKEEISDDGATQENDQE